MSECLLYSDPELYDLLFPSADGSAAMLDAVRRERLVNSERYYVNEVQAGGCASGVYASGHAPVRLGQTVFNRDHPWQFPAPSAHYR